MAKNDRYMTKPTSSSRLVASRSMQRNRTLRKISSSVSHTRPSIFSPRFTLTISNAILPWFRGVKIQLCQHIWLTEIVFTPIMIYEQLRSQNEPSNTNKLKNVHYEKWTYTFNLLYSFPGKSNYLTIYLIKSNFNCVFCWNLKDKQYNTKLMLFLAVSTIKTGNFCKF